MTLDEFCKCDNMFRDPITKEAAEWILMYQRCLALCGVLDTGNGVDDSVCIKRVMLSKVHIADEKNHVPAFLREKKHKKSHDESPKFSEDGIASSSESPKSLVGKTSQLSSVDKDSVPLRSNKFIAIREHTIQDGTSIKKELWLSGFLKLNSGDGRPWWRENGSSQWLIKKGESFFIDVDKYLENVSPGLPVEQVVREKEIFFYSRSGLQPDPQWRVVKKFQPAKKSIPSLTQMSVLVNSRPS